ncbi:hypothetical protein Tco_0897716 [Tanacetum coccineum]
MDPVIRCTTLPSHSRSLKGFLFHFSWRSIHFYRLSHSELDDIEKVAVCSSLRLLKTKNALLKHPSDTKVLTMKMEILLEPTSNKLLVVGFNPLVHSFRALSTLRRSGLRTASAAAKPCQGDSSEVYLITGRILMVAGYPTVAKAAGQDINVCGMPVRRSHHLMEAYFTTRDDKRFTVADDLKRKLKDHTSLKDKAQGRYKCVVWSIEFIFRFSPLLGVVSLVQSSVMAACGCSFRISSLVMHVMALNNAQTKTNSSAFRSMLEKHQLTGPNFNEWLRALKLVVRTEKLHDVFETPLPPAPAASADNQALADWMLFFIVTMKLLV